MSSTVDLHVRG